MRICRFSVGDYAPALGVIDDSGAIYPLCSRDGALLDMDGWLSRPDALGFAWRAAQEAMSREPISEDAAILAPLQTQEVWAAGVTYERSRTARMGESEGGGDFYDRVYRAERPELFLKATPRRVSPPGEPIRIRADSEWDVPEPELTCVIDSAGRIAGYTIGDDVSSRSIEGENPLYLPQAKTYDGCCSIGPVIALAGEGGIESASGLEIGLRVIRGEDAVFDGSVGVSRMRRTPEELSRYLFRDQSFPAGVLLMTGTGIVPPDDFTLSPGDIVEIAIEEIGTLVNTVVRSRIVRPDAGKS